jgi:AraC family transcriptional regulator of adaptative response / DNA-3-methyladenine glycosylase II
MLLDDEACYRAMVSRDRRFEGRFVVGVTTTGIYCRPGCPARTPKRSNVKFFATPAAAEGVGLRACKRCRPDSAPGSPAWIGTPATVTRALRLIESGALDEAGVESLAERLGVGARHLRRLFDEHLGASPISVASSQRAHLARRLLESGQGSIADIAFASGFSSLRRFNAAVRSAFAASPTELRGRAMARAKKPADDGGLSLKLSVRPPFDFKSILAFLAARAIPRVERVTETSYARTFEIGGVQGTLEVTRGSDIHLNLTIHAPARAPLMTLVARVRGLFDLDADPDFLAEHLSRSPDLAERVARRPGLRVPGAWDGFELAVRAILGQQISVRGATTIAGRLAERHGAPISPSVEGLDRVFPVAVRVAEDDQLNTIGLTAARTKTLRAVAREVATGELSSFVFVDLASAMARLTRIPGIGAWTAAYIAMRAGREPDAFPAGDLVLRKRLGGGEPLSERDIEARSQAWRPFRAYAAMHIWASDDNEGERA